MLIKTILVAKLVYIETKENMKSHVRIVARIIQIIGDSMRLQIEIILLSGGVK
jgi:hypothetical protein